MATSSQTFYTAATAEAATMSGYYSNGFYPQGVLYRIGGSFASANYWLGRQRIPGYKMFYAHLHFFTRMVFYWLAAPAAAV